jgi:hypothetical protein
MRALKSIKAAAVDRICRLDRFSPAANNRFLRDCDVRASRDPKLPQADSYSSGQRRMPAAFPRKSSPSRMQRESMASEACPVCCMALNPLALQHAMNPKPIQSRLLNDDDLEGLSGPRKRSPLKLR